MTKNNSLLQTLDKATIYEVNIRQYTQEGTIEAFIEHLPRLKKMGVDVIWLMPMHTIGKKNRKGSLGSYYSISDFTDINPEFGTKHEFKNLIHEIHALGMKVIMDWVANHAAWDNIWTINHPDFFASNEAGEFLSPYDWTDVIQINHENEQAHDALREAMCYWVKEFDIDGFRADLAHLTPVHDVNALLVFAAGRGDVTDVWVAGDQVVANRTSTKIDLTDLIKRVNHRVKALDPLR